MADTRYCITLVHGTFARGAAWTRDGSVSREVLKSGLGNVEFGCFEWTGSNDDDGRRLAANALAEQVVRGIETNPQAQHAIVAHSHGGNILLRAAADPRVVDRLSHLVCISTPFFVTKGRDILTTALTLVRYYAWFFAITSLLFVLMYQSTSMSKMSKYGMPANTREFVPWIVAAVAGFAVALGLQWSRGPVAAWVAARQERRMAEIALPRLIHAQVLCVWAKGDEVMLLFRALDRLAGLSLLLLRPWPALVVLVLTFVWLAPEGNNAIFKLGGALGFDSIFFAAVVYSILPFALLVDYVLRFELPWLLILFTSASMAIMTMALLTLVVWIAAAVLHVVLKLVPFGMTNLRLVDTFFLGISPSQTPPDRSNVAVMEMSLPRRGLMHSAVYRSETALRKIVAFIRT